MKEGKTFGEVLFGNKEHKRQMKRVEAAEMQERKSPNNISFHYRDGVVVTVGYATIDNLLEGLNAEARNLERRWLAREPIPKKIIIKFDRRVG